MDHSSSAEGGAAPVRMGVVGMGGYGGRMIDLLLRMEQEGNPSATLVAVSSTNPARHGALASRLSERGVGVGDSFEALLSLPDVEAVWLPVPINLHLPYLERTLESGKAVLLEKPVAGTVDECDRMVESAGSHGRAVAVGYQSIYDPSTTMLKQRILAGELGRIQHVTLRAAWPRSTAYYGRASWAGRLRHEGAWILDSPLQNALNHFVNLTLFLLGREPTGSATPVAVQAELYRVNDIETFDTASIRLTLDSGIDFLILLTHATATTVDPVIRLIGDRRVATWRFDDSIVVADEKTGSQEVTPILPVEEQRSVMVSTFSRLVRGIPHPETTVATLEQARSTLVAVNGTSEAAPVQSVDKQWIEVIEQEDGSQLKTIPGLEAVLALCASRGQMLHESAAVQWSVPGLDKDLAGYRSFSGPYAPGG